MKLSTRNQHAGTVAEVRRGEATVAVIKASDVMLGRN